MKKMMRILIVMLVLVIGLQPVATVSAAGATHGVNIRGDLYYDVAFTLLNRINAARSAQGRSALTMNASMMESAMARAGELSVYFSNNRPNGDAGHTISSLGVVENVAGGYNNVDDVMTAWNGNANGRNNMLSAEFKSAGVGVVVVDGVTFWSVIFSDATSVAAKKPANTSGTMTVTSLVDNLKLDLKYPASPYNVICTKKTATPIVFRNKGVANFGLTIEPSDLVITSSNPSVIRPDNNGNLESFGWGSATITVTLKNYPSIKMTFTAKSVVYYGDTDLNGKVEANDALLALQAATGKITLNEYTGTAANVDKDNKITANDALMILQASTGKITL